MRQIEDRGTRVCFFKAERKKACLDQLSERADRAADAESEGSILEDRRFG